MKQVWNDIIKYAVLGNIFHLLLSYLYTFVESTDTILLSSILGLILIMWLFMGFKFAFKTNKKSEMGLLALGLVSLLPIMLFLITCQSLEGLKNINDIQNYSMFYFLGTPALFWNKPFIPIMSLFKESSIYIQLDINVAVIFLVICLGGYLGYFLKNKFYNKKEKTLKKV